MFGMATNNSTFRRTWMQQCWYGGSKSSCLYQAQCLFKYYKLQNQMSQCYLTKFTKQYNQCRLKPALVLLKKKMFPPYGHNYAQNWSVPPNQTKMVLIQRCSHCSIVLNLTLISMECKPNKKQTLLHRKVGNHKTKFMQQTSPKHCFYINNYGVR